MSKPFNYGGQAVIEGVMMRGQKFVTIAVRKLDAKGRPDPGGEIVVRCEPLNQRIYGSRINKIPFVRGVTMLWDALVLGMNALMFSANVSMANVEQADSQVDEAATKDKADTGGDEKGGAFEGPIAWGTVAISLSLAVGLFFVLPLLIVGLIERFTGEGLFSNVLEGIIRLVIFIGYVWGIGLLPDVKRVFGYHGAEHKAINAYENDAPLIPQKMAEQSITHPRCGTAFLLIVMVISIFLFVLLGTPSLWIRIVSRVLLIPVIAGVAYEFLKFSAAHAGNPFMKMLIAPGLALQGLTTREPDESMLEVAGMALTRLLEEEDRLPRRVSNPEALSVEPLASTADM